MAEASSYLFTSESVTEGHPDKMCDQISDAILDAIISKEIELEREGYIAPSGQPADVSRMRCACETMATTGLVVVAGEIRTQAYVDVPAIVREVVCGIGYDRAKYGFDGTTCGVVNAIHEQSPDIAQGVDESWEAVHGGAADDPYERIGAGDQGMMFGYACDETKTLMPMPIYLAQRMSERLAAVRKDGTLDYLRPDGKTQVSVRYEDGAPKWVEKVVVSTQHAEDVSPDKLREAIINHVVGPVFSDEGTSIMPGMEIHVNPTGRFVIGGPMGDCGLTGRKVIVDTYGGMGRHGGGAFSGKDCTKVDRSAAYAARWVAKNVVAAGLARRCEVQVAYAIGMARPVSVMVDTFGTAAVDASTIERAVAEVFDLRPGAIIDALDLRRPIYRKTAAYGHFGRELPEFTWERTDKVDELREACGSPSFCIAPIALRGLRAPESRSAGGGRDRRARFRRRNGHQTAFWHRFPCFPPCSFLRPGVSARARRERGILAAIPCQNAVSWPKNGPRHACGGARCLPPPAFRLRERSCRRPRSVRHARLLHRGGRAPEPRLRRSFRARPSRAVFVRPCRARLPRPGLGIYWKP